MSENSIKFSVVLPIYNVEKYLNRCVESVINQTYKNLEIILVDDGSPDNCPQMCEEWAKKDERIKVVHKQNAGLGMARNTGIENATGDYICFFDSDDFVDKNLFQECYKNLLKQDFDIIEFDYMSYNNGNIKYYPKREKDTIFSGSDVQDVLFKNMIYNPNNAERLHNCAWNKIYSMKLIKEIGFRYVSEREYISEDHFSNLILFKYVKSALVLKEPYYYYCFNCESLTHSYNKHRFEKNIFQFDKSIELCNELQYSSQIKDAVAFQSFLNILGTFHNLLITNELTNKEKFNVVKNIIKDKRFNKLFKSLKTKNEKSSRKILIFALKHKFVLLSYLLLKMKYRG